MTEVLLCTSSFWNDHGHRVQAVAPGTTPLLLVPDLSDDDLATATLAFFSPDAFPGQTREFLGTATRATNLRWFHSMSAGVDTPVFTTYMENGARLTTSSGTSAPPIARTVIMYLLALSRGLPDLMAAQAERRWAPRQWSELLGRRVGVLGYGSIGRELVPLLSALGLAPIVFRRSVRGDEQIETRRLDELAEVAPSLDALVAVVPLTDDTKRIVSAEVIDQLPPHAFVINVGRGRLVDQDALLAALEAGELGGAGLDVTDPEPLPADHPLWNAPNTIITPHVSGTTSGTTERVIELFFDNLRAWVDGDPLRNEVLPGT